MRRLVTSRGYQRARIVSGGAAAMLGAAIVAREVHDVGANLNALPAYVMGAALIALGVARVRDYRAGRGVRPKAP